jgi:pimeloyl-ACP methyl ester carboxylesterase
MTVERDVRLTDGRLLRTYDSGGDGFTILWHHGSPQTGVPLVPLLAAAAERELRLLSYARPGYGGSTPSPGRDVASAASDVGQLADALGVDRFAVMGASGGGPHVLACAALLPGRVMGAVCLASPAPFADDFDWSAGMRSPGGLLAATKGRDARAHYAASDEFDPDNFTEADWAALAGTWSSLGADAQLAGGAGPGGLIDDDVAFAGPWGFDLSAVTAPVLLVQGGEDRVIPPAHADRLLPRLRRAELWLRPGDGHVSVLDACAPAMDWLHTHTHP